MAVSGSVHLGLLAFLTLATTYNLGKSDPIEVNFLGPKTNTPFSSSKSTSKAKKAEPKLEKVAGAPAVARDNDAANSSSEEVSGNENTIAATNSYEQEITAEINRNKTYPLVALKLRQQGQVKVRFRVARNGQVLEAEILERSAFDSLNSAARRLIEEIHQFRPIPSEIKATSWLFTVPIEYKM